MAWRGSRRGFSLTELAVVLGVLILAAAIIFPSIGALKRQGRLRVGAATVAESLRTARSLAIAQSAAYSVDSPTTSQIRIYPGSAAYASGPVYRVETLPRGVLRESMAPAFVSFQPDGSLAQTGDLAVVIRDEQPKPDKRTITVKAASGRIAVSGGSR